MSSLIIDKNYKQRKKFPFFTSYSTLQSGFTVVEVIIVLVIFSILVGLVTVNLFKFQHISQISSTLDSFLADYKEQQIKAMVGDTDNTGSVASYGIHIETSSYTLFRNVYGTSNFVVSLPSSLQFTTTFPGSEVIFATGSGALTSFTNGQNTITLKDTVDGTQKIITINRYGVVSAVN